MLGLIICQCHIYESDSSLDPYVFGLGAWLNPKILGLTACQIHMYLSLTRSKIQGYWVWQRVAEFKNIGFSSSSDSHVFRLSAWLNLRILGLVAR